MYDRLSWGMKLNIDLTGLFVTLSFVSGVVLGVITVALLLICLGALRSAPERKRVKLERRMFDIGSVSQAFGANKLLRKLYPRLAHSKWLEMRVAKGLSGISREDSIIKAIPRESVSIKVDGCPPTIDSICLCTSSEGDYVEVSFAYEAKITANASAHIRVPMVGNIVSIGALVSIRNISGGVRIFVPMHKGRVEIHIVPSTKIDCDVGANITESMPLKLRTEDLGGVWRSLVDFVQRRVHAMRPKIPIEELFEPKVMSKGTRRIRSAFPDASVKVGWNK